MNLKKYFLLILPLLGITLACTTFTNFIAPAPSATPVTVLFEDSEFSNSCYLESSDAVQRSVQDGRYIMHVTSPSYIAWSDCTGTEFTDFILEADATPLSGPENNAFGVVFRYGLDADEFYAFVISSDGYYALTVDGSQHAKAEYLVEWTKTPAIQTGNQTNHIKVMARGDSIKYFVNDQQLGEIQDSRFSSGTIGFITGSIEEGGVQVAFDNLKVLQP